MSQRTSFEKSTEMIRLVGALMRAQKHLSTSIVSLVGDIQEQAERYVKSDIERPLCLLGIKEKGVPTWVKDRLTPEKGYIHITVDRMAPGGRAIDTGLINPLTGKMMTGSTSGGAVNLLKGITDIAIGTDGGGSVLGPALATQLFAIMGKGLGLGTGEHHKATDGKWFEPAIGILGRNLEEILKTVEDLMDMPGVFLKERQNKDLSGIKIGYPGPGIALPDGKDMADALRPVARNLEARGAETFEIKAPDGLWDRQQSLSWLRSIWPEKNSCENPCDVIVTREGPVDLFGIGDSVAGLLGETGELLQKSSGKYLLRSANMAGCTALAIPGRELASGYIVICPQGVESAKKAVRVAGCLVEYDERPALFEEYFGKKLFDLP